MDQSNKHPVCRLYRVKKINLVTELHMNSGAVTMVLSVVPSLEVPGNQMGPRGTARNDKSLKCSISVAAPRNPMVLPLETPWCCPSKPLRRPSKPHGAVPRNPRCAAPQNPWGQILRPKFSSFGGF